MEDKITENRLRLKAARCGLQLQKSPRRDPAALDFGLYALRNIATGKYVNQPLRAQFIHSWTMKQVAAYFAPSLNHYTFTAEEVARHKCIDCGVNVIEAGDYCNLTNRIWRDQFGLGGDDNLCLACIEQRLGRKLGMLDFAGWPGVRGYPTSSELMARYGSMQQPEKKKPTKKKRKAK